MPGNIIKREDGVFTQKGEEEWMRHMGSEAYLL